MRFTEPVLLTGFNRPATMRVVLNRLKDVRPPVMFVAIDGPRGHVPSDAALVQECRALVREINWDCELHTLFQDQNLGCGRGMSTAITWFFNHVDQGIILEDDVVPNGSFFDFCSELLKRYEHDERVFAISGCNVVPSKDLSQPTAPYRFSRIPIPWGWATWRRSWSRYRLDIRPWRSRLPPARLTRLLGFSPSMSTMWATEFELTSRGTVDTWDWQLAYAAMIGDQLIATSNVNLIENIGFGSVATHTHQPVTHLAPPQPFPFPVGEVPVVWDRRADQWATRHHLGGSFLTSLDRLQRYARSSKAPVAPWH